MWRKLALAACFIGCAFVLITYRVPNREYKAPVTVLGAQVTRSVTEDEIASVRPGLPYLTEDPVLNRVAQARVIDMTANGYYSHKAPPGENALFSTIIQQGQTGTDFICENLHLSESDQTETILSDWLLSTTGHKECLLHQKPTRFGFARGFYDTVRFDDGDKTLYVYVLILSE